MLPNTEVERAWDDVMPTVEDPACVLDPASVVDCKAVIVYISEDVCASVLVPACEEVCTIEDEANWDVEPACDVLCLTEVDCCCDDV